MINTSELPHRRLKNGFVAALLAASCAFAIAPAAKAEAVDHEAASTVSEAADRTMAALEDADISDSEAEQLLALVDVDRVAQFSLGNHWQDISADQQERFTSAFRVYAKRQLQQHLSGLTNATVEVTDVVPRGDEDAVVVTQARTEDEAPQTISWRVIKNDSWSIVDIEVQDVWFAIEQRAQFDAMLDKNNGDVEKLIAELSGSPSQTG